MLANTDPQVVSARAGWTAQTAQYAAHREGTLMTVDLPKLDLREQHFRVPGPILGCS